MYTLKDFEDYLRRKNPGKYDKIVSNIYPAKASSMDKPSTAPETPTISDTVRPWDVENKENTFYANEGNSGIMRQKENSDPYAIQEPRQAPYTNPYDIPQGYNPNDYVYKSTQQAPTNDPHGKTWTPEEQKRKQLSDLKIEKDNLEASFFSMPTTKDVVKLGEYDDEIKRLTQQLGQGEQNSMLPAMTEPIQRYSQPETKPFVPTMTEPIRRYGQPEASESVPEMTEPIQRYSQPEASGSNSDPYAITWTPEQEKRKRLHDAQIKRENLQQGFVGMPTTADIVKLGEYDDVIKQLTQELGLGQKEYTPGVEGGWQEETKAAPYTPGVEGGDIGVDALQGVHFGGSGIDRGVPDTGGAGGGGGGSWGAPDEDLIEIPSNINQDISGDPEAIDVIWRSDMFKDMVREVAKYADDDQIKTNLDLDVIEEESVELTAEEAESLYAQLCEQESFETNFTADFITTGLGIVLGAACPPLGVAIAAGALVGSIFTDFDTSVDYDIDDLLGGTYTVSTFKLDGGWDLYGLKNEHTVCEGIIVRGEPVTMDDGTIIENPFNTVIYTSYDK